MTQYINNEKVDIYKVGFFYGDSLDNNSYVL